MLNAVATQGSLVVPMAHLTRWRRLAVSDPRRRGTPKPVQQIDLVLYPILMKLRGPSKYFLLPSCHLYAECASDVAEEL
jgi:hypothetical protein